MKKLLRNYTNRRIEYIKEDIKDDETQFRVMAERNITHAITCLGTKMMRASATVKLLNEFEAFETPIRTLWVDNSDYERGLQSFKSMLKDRLISLLSGGTSTSSDSMTQAEYDAEPVAIATLIRELGN